MARKVDYGSYRVYWREWVGKYWTSQPPTDSRDYLISIPNELIETHDHPGWRKLAKRGVDVGGEFEVVKRDYAESSTLPIPSHFSDSVNPMAVTIRHFHGNQWATVVGPSQSYFPEALSLGRNRLKALGTEGINRTLPTKSEADLGTFIGELREGLPSVLGFAGRGRSVSRKLASENLNYQFGLKPFISEVQGFANVVRDSEKLLDQYQRNANKRLKRSVVLLEERNTVRSGTSSRYPKPTLVSNFYTNIGTAYTLTTTSRRVWFEGCYTYFIPSAPFRRRIAEADQLLGTTPDLEMLYNLAPWSWAADWVSNMGSLVENYTAFSSDGLVLRYGYVMEETSVTRHDVLEGVGIRSYPGRHTFTQTFTTTRKRRIRASPYGFAVDWEGFTPRQLSILASLGITRGRR